MNYKHKFGIYTYRCVRVSIVTTIKEGYKVCWRARSRKTQLKRVTV
jgi:hypothetical protein